MSSPYDQWTDLKATQQRLRVRKHYNGTCVCYTAPGMGINGTRNSGKDCLYAYLTGQQQNAYRHMLDR